MLLEALGFVDEIMCDGKGLSVRCPGRNLTYIIMRVAIRFFNSILTSSQTGTIQPNTRPPYPMDPDVVLGVREVVGRIFERQRLPMPVTRLLPLAYDPFSFSARLAVELVVRHRLDDNVTLGL